MIVTGWRSIGRWTIETPDDAVAFVEAMGFCTWGPVPGVDFPNLAEAMGETASSVMTRTWFWKDDLHVEQRIYYGKIIRGQPTFIAPEYLPDFIAALSADGGREPDRLYRNGLLSREARLIYDYLAEHPRRPTRELRRGIGLASKDQSAATERGLVELQRRFLICKVDITGRTRGTYSYVWDLAERFWPDAFEEASRTSPAVARSRIRSRLRAFGLAEHVREGEADLQLENRLFLW